ncbi:MAG: sensor histidine kinase [Prolixibacteraceae bacterium]
MPKTKIKFTESFIFVSIWFLFYLSPIIANNNSDGVDWKPILFTWIIFLPFLIASFVNHYLLFPILFHKRKVIYFSVTALLLVGLALTSGRMHRSINAPAMDQERLFSDGPDRRPFPPPEHRFNDESEAGPLSENRPLPFSRRPGDLPPFLNTLFIGLLVIGFDIGLRTTFKWTQTEQEKEKLEKEKVKNELAFLRNQLSPHFFMNTLNNIHSLIDIDTEEAKESIIRLSKLMRHLLYDSNEDFILLAKEVQFIQSYVDLMKLRFTDKVKVTFNVGSEISNILIPPLLFTSLIENAFKYGVSYKQKSFIKINLSIEDKSLLFSIQNSKIDNKNSEEGEIGGIGLDNTRKRLDLLYASNYEMKIDETPEIFSVQLKLPL